MTLKGLVSFPLFLFSTHCLCMNGVCGKEDSRQHSSTWRPVPKHHIEDTQAHDADETMQQNVDSMVAEGVQGSPGVVNSVKKRKCAILGEEKLVRGPA